MKTVPARIAWSSAMPKAATAGFIAGVLALHWVLVLLVFPACGAVAVWLYHRDPTAPRVTTGGGFRIGMVAGFFASATNTLVAVAQYLANKEEMLKEVAREVEIAMARNPNPQAESIIRQFLTPQGLLVLLAMGTVFLMFFALVLAGSGGALGASLGRKDK